MISRRTALKSVALGAASALAIAGMLASAHAENKKLKIGFVGVTSGPAAAWGTSNVRSMQVLADWLNEKGGVKIGDNTYDIEIVTFDDQKDPKRAVAGMEKMAEQGIHYVVGPNVDDGAAAGEVGIVGGRVVGGSLHDRDVVRAGTGPGALVGAGRAAGQEGGNADKAQQSFHGMSSAVLNSAAD